MIVDTSIIKVSSSLIKQFLFKGDVLEHCPKHIYACSIANTHKFETLPMLRGCYFETGCIGSTGNGEQVLDLPRKKFTKKQETDNRLAELKGLPPVHIGEKGIDQTRIDERISMFHQKKNEFGLNLTKDNTQVVILKRHPEYKDCILKIIMDIFPAIIVIDDNTILFAFDLKLTKGIDFVWGNAAEKDHVQMKMYHEMMRDIDFDLNPHLRNVIDEKMLSIINSGNAKAAYWVWDYKDDEQIIDRIIPYAWDNTRRAELYEDIRKTYNFVKHYHANGWNANPSYERCKNCPLTKDECPDKEIIQVI